MPSVTINGKIADAGERSDVLVIVRPGPGHTAAVTAGRQLIRSRTGTVPSQWTDGTGTTTITASSVPAPVAPELTPDEAFAQQAAELFRAAAASENQLISRYDMPAYQHARELLAAAVEAAYDVGPEISGRVVALVSEYGPDDSLQGSPRRGVWNYVHFAVRNPEYRYLS